MSELTLTVSTEGVTSPQGFLAGAVAAGIRSDGRADLALLYSERPCSAAALFTASTLKAAPVLLSQRHLADGKAQAVIVNSGCANAYVGDQGRRDAEERARRAGSKLRLSRGESGRKGWAAAPRAGGRSTPTWRRCSPS